MPAAAIPMPAPSVPSDPAPSLPASATVMLALSGEGLAFVTESGSVRHFPFDTPAEDAIAAITRSYAGLAPHHTRNEECGAGPLDMASWHDGLTVLSQEGRWLGWSVSRAAAAGDAPGPKTMAGIGIDSTRSELQAAYTADMSETTLGQEFSAGDLHGILDGTGPTARINAMWAGVSCNFR